MPAAQRVGDANSGGGKVTKSKQSTVFINNKLVAVDGSDVSGHGPGPHGAPKTAKGSKNVFINNIPVNRTGDTDTCGHPRQAGSPDVFVN